MEKSELNRIKGNIMDYLRGYARANPAGMGALLACEFLPELAHEERRRRAARFISVLPDDELIAVASGDIDIRALAGEL